MKNLVVDKFRIPMEEFAVQGNAVLGIRGSGKSYTATYIAERMLESGIPFIAFDPIGIWKFLRVKGKKEGYKVVVAGGKDGDLGLTPRSAPDIVRAAMTENIPLVIDLYDMTLSKADWKKIVMDSVRLLLYENGSHGLRHIFIEEAAEFCPQRVGPDQGGVYAEIEKLARMGGNAQLGYTLINQRPEEVNKAVLELCDCLFLHRQKGRNSLTSLGKWLDFGSKDSKKIMESIPMLPAGDCWVWPAESDTPIRIHVPEKNSFHPDRKAKTAPLASRKSEDVQAFVSKMAHSLADHIEVAKSNNPEELKKRINALERELKVKERAQPEPKIVNVPIVLDADLKRLEGALQMIKEIQANATRQITFIEDELKVIKGARSAPAPVRIASTQPGERILGVDPRPRPAGESDLNGPEQRIVDAIAWFGTIGQDAPLQVAVAFLAGYTFGGGAFNNPRGALKRKGCVQYIGGDRIKLTPEGLARATPQDHPLTIEELRAHVLEILPGPEAKIISVLFRPEYQGAPVSKDDLATESGYTMGGGAFNNPLGRLRSLGLIQYVKDDDRPMVKLENFLIDFSD